MVVGRNMAHISLSKVGSSPFEQLMGHAPNVLAHWSKLEDAFFQSTTFGAEFLEQIRRALAYDNQCFYCMAKAGPPESNPRDQRLVVALKFANQFAIDHKLIEAADVARLKDFFSVAEISELISFCSFISASQRFGAVLGLQPMEKKIL